MADGVTLREFMESKLDAIHGDVIRLAEYQKAMNGKVGDHAGDIKVIKALLGLIGAALVPALGVLMWVADKVWK